VHADEFEARRGQHSAHRLGGRARADGQPELLVVGAGGDRPVGVRVHAGGDPNQDALASRPGPDGGQRGDLVQAVDHDAPDSHRDGAP